VLTIIDTFTRLSPAIDVRQSYRGADVVATLERAAIETSLPKTIRVDNGPEFVSKELDLSSAPSRLSSRVPASRLTTPLFSRSTASSVQSA
jgi:transposase InsO family protein